ncbi:MAG: TonB-dependent receptor [Cytophagales bacterium]|nr:TonB-dependent receptor [Cytophagales bacterium]
MSAEAVSQDRALEGYVFDAKTNKPLPYVNVYLRKHGSGDITDINGYFKINIYSDDILTASFMGYRTEETAVSISGLKEIKIFLHQATKALAEIEIRAIPYLMDDSFNDMSNSKYMLVKEAILTLPSLTGEADFIKNLLLLPGATKGVEGSSDIFVRGGDADQNLVLFNGATVYNTGHLFGFLSVFNPYATSDATMLTGGFTSQYGGRLSSIIDITSRKPSYRDFVVEGSIGTLASNLAVELPIVKDRLSLMVAGRRTYADQVVRLLGESLPYYFYDFNAQIDFKLNGALNFQYHFYKGDDDLDYRRELRENLNTGTNFLIENNTHSFLIDKTYNSRISSTTNLHYTQFRYHINSFFDENQLRVNSEINDLGLEHQFVYRQNENHEFTSGLSVIRHNVVPNFIDSNGEIAEFIPSGNGRIRNMLESAIYSSWRYSKAKISTELGLRLSSAYQEESFYINPEPRLNVRWQIKENDAFKVSYSRMFQYMNRASSSSFALPTDIWYPVTSQVKPQFSDQVTAGYQHIFKQPGILASLDVYYKSMTNQIAFREATNLTLNNEFEEALLQGKGSSYGAEVLLRREAGKLRGWLAYTLSWSDRQFDELNNGQPFRARYDRRHNLSLVTNYTPHPRWTFSAVWEFISGARFTPVIGYYVMPNAALTGVDLIPVYPERNSVGLNDSHRLDLSITLHGRRRPDKKWYGEWQLSFYNAYNRATPIAISLNYDDESNRYFYEQPGLFGMLPSLTYRFTFEK